MTLSIRARLTLWYSSVVVGILVTAAVVGVWVQSELALRRLDDDLAASMATLEAVMRTEFGEGLDLEGAAAEASSEVVVPDRTLALTSHDGRLLRVWGLPLDGTSLRSIVGGADAGTVITTGGQFRVLRKVIEHNGYRYTAAVIASLEVLQTERAEMVRAMSLGVAMALLAAVAGGWLIGRQTLRPLTRMADQARRINERDLTQRLDAPPVDDELGRLAVSFNELLGRLASALTHQRQFMADASHELRTPVSVVCTATHVTLSKTARTPEEYREALVIVAEQATRLSRLVDAMFLLSRAEAQGVPLCRQFVNLDDILAESARAFRVLANQRHVVVTTNGEAEVGLNGDDALLRQMIGNLLDNAIRHAAPHGRVVASVTRSADQVALRITNDGQHVSPDDRERIFQRFVRLGSSDGAGLGLPIARWIAEAHGGALRLEESQPDSTTFVVTLPAGFGMMGSPTR